VRNVIYFGGNAIGTSLVILAAYLVGGALVVIALRRRARAAGAAVAEAEAASAAVPVI
jgi:hypothetical protein